MERTEKCLACGKSMPPFNSSRRKFCNLECIDEFQGLGRPLSAQERIDVLTRVHGLHPYDKFEKIINK